MWKYFLPYVGRFLDDIFGFWKGTQASFDTFVEELNEWSNNNGWGMRFVHGAFGKRVAFLDLEIYQNQFQQWHTTLYFKTTDVHAYLLPTSNHPTYIIRSIPLGVAIRIARACSEWVEFQRVRHNLFPQAEV